MFVVMCRKLDTLLLEESTIAEKENDEWLRELATSNTVLETLNFFLTDIYASPEYLALLVRNCRRLKILKISECSMPQLIDLFRTTETLQEFAGGSFEDYPDQGGQSRNYNNYYFPPSIQRLSFNYMGTNEMQILFPYCAALKKLDLTFTFLTTQDHCQLVQRCPNLEVLEVCSGRLCCMIFFLLLSFMFGSWIVNILPQACYADNLFPF
jgi:coronatine-insensitive protein 1